MLPNIEVNPIVESMAAQITSKVLAIRGLKASIADASIRFGITADEEQINAERAELLELMREYKSLTGENWADEEGYARYVSPGESHKYTTKNVDEALAALMALNADIVNVLFNCPIWTYDGDGKLTAEQAYEQLAQHYRSQLEEAQIRLEAVDAELKKLAAARKTTTTKETVSVK